MCQLFKVTLWKIVFPIYKTIYSDYKMISSLMKNQEWSFSVTLSIQGENDTKLLHAQSF